MEQRPLRSARANKRVLIAILIVLLVATLIAVVPGLTGHGVRRASAVTKDTPAGLGQLSGLLPRDHLTEESAIQVDLNNETVRLPLYKGEAYGKTAWFILLDASDAGLAHDLGVNFAPKLANIGISCPACVQTVTLYYFTPDSATQSACSDQCAQTWPPLFFTGSGSPTSSANLSGKLSGEAAPGCRLLLCAGTRGANARRELHSSLLWS